MKRIDVIRKMLLCFPALTILIWGFLFPVTGFAEPYLQDGLGMVSMETEYFDTQVIKGGYEWAINYTSGYSGTAAMKAPAVSFITNYMEKSPRLDYNVDFQYSGVHYLWVRAYAASSASNSLHAGLNGGTAAVGDFINVTAFGSYVWAKTTLTIPSVGVHTLNLWVREANTIADKIVVTTDAGYVPSGFGPPESPRGEDVWTVASPVIDPSGGTFTDGVTVSISADTPGADIYYTLDGSTPTEASTLYTSPFLLSASATLKAKGILAGYNDSSVVIAVFTITSDTPGGGAEAYLQDGLGMVSMETEYFDTQVIKGGYEWALNYTSGYSGTAAMKAPAVSFITNYMEKSPRLDYNVDFQYSGVHYLWVRAYAASSASNSLHAGLNGGTAAVGDFINVTAFGSYVWAKTTLTIPSVGVHTLNLWVREANTIADKIVVTTDAGYVPSGFGPPESPRGEDVWTVASPVIDPSGGTFTDGVTVSISADTPGADIYYTLDGSTPTEASTLYTSPFLLSASATLKAKGILAGYNDSSVVIAVFTITSDTPGGGAEAYLQDGLGMVSMETEYFDTQVIKGGYEWALNYTSGYSGTAAMKAPAVSFITNYMEKSPRLDYNVDFQYSGVHYLWVRAYAASSASNSLHAGLNGGTAAVGDFINVTAFGSYVWAKTTLTIPSVGVHTLNLWVREANTIADKIVVTTDAGYVPSGFGPPESPRGFLCDTVPSVAILSPEPGHLQIYSDLTVTTQTCLDNVLHAGWGVKIELDGGVVNGGRVSYVYTPPYETTFDNLALGEHTVEVFVVDSGGKIVSGVENQDYVDRVGIGDHFVAIGDSITRGTGDDDPSDDISPDGRNIGGGFPPILNNLLTHFLGYPNTIINEGVGGTTSGDGLFNLPAVLQRNPDARWFLIMYGMNDARPWAPVPSGLGLSPGDSGYPGTFKDNMQSMVNLILSNEKEVLLAKSIIALGDSATGSTYDDPNEGARSLLIRQYNGVIDELFVANTDIMFYPPDFYSYFSNTYAIEYSDNIHPNGQGYRSMADIWFDALTLPEYQRK
jgi:lysophospholipase L1-like esterase/heme exporter protein D